MLSKSPRQGLRKEHLGGTGEKGAVMHYVPIGADGAFKMASKIVLDEGGSIGYHLHKDDEEVYFIMSGEGLYSEEGEEVKVGAGDVLLCTRGRSHGLKNTGKGKLILGAAIAAKE